MEFKFNIIFQIIMRYWSFHFIANSSIKYSPYTDLTRNFFNVWAVYENKRNFRYNVFITNCYKFYVLPILEKLLFGLKTTSFYVKKKEKVCRKYNGWGTKKAWCFNSELWKKDMWNVALSSKSDFFCTRNIPQTH